MKYIYLFIVIMSLFFSGQVYATTMYGATAFTGGGAGAVDALDITGATSPNEDNLVEGDSVVVTTISGSTVEVTFLVFDASGTDAENSPTVIRPDDYSTAGVWRKTDLKSLGISSFAESFLDDADEATFKATVNLEAGTDFYSISGADAAFESADATIIKEADVDDTPVNGATTDPISSNYMYDHENGADPHTVYMLESVLVTTVGDPGSDTSYPTEQAVREAIDAIPGGGDVSAAANFGTDNVVVRSDGTSKGVQATGVTIDDNDVVTTPGGFSVTPNATGPQISCWYEDTDNTGSNYVCVGAPASITNNLALVLPQADPTAGQTLSCAVPSSVTWSDGVARNTSVCTWQTPLVDTANAVDYTHTEGTYKAQAPLVGDPDLWTLTTDHHYGGVLIANADGEDTLNAVAAGMSLTLKTYATVSATYNPNASDTIVRNGVALAQGEALVTSAAYGVCVLEYQAANTWSADCSTTMTEETP